MKALVTGGAGFIGSHIVDELIFQGHEVTVVDNFETGKPENVNPKAFLVRQSIVEGLQHLAPHDVIFHTAALARIQPSIQDPPRAHKTNVLGTLMVLEAARAWGAKVVFSSSSSIYGLQEADEMPEKEDVNDARPASPYALQKLECEQYLKLYHDLYGVRSTALRYFNVYGERQILEGAYAALVGILFDQYSRHVAFTVTGDGEQRRDFTYVKDVVRANIKAWEVGYQGVVNVGTGRNHSVNEICTMIDPNWPIEYLPKRPGEARETLADNSKARDLLSWEPETKIADWIGALIGIMGKRSNLTKGKETTSMAEETQTPGEETPVTPPEAPETPAETPSAPAPEATPAEPGAGDEPAA